MQATDQTIGVRRARVLLVDYDGVRAPVIATWLVQLGFEAALIDARNATSLHVDKQIASPQSSLPLLDAAALREAETGHVLLLDLRSSAAYRREHAAGAHWSIRPLLAKTLAALKAEPGDTLLLFADEPAVAGIAATDLRELGFTSLYLAASGVDTWKEAGLAACIDTRCSRRCRAHRLSVLCPRSPRWQPRGRSRISRLGDRSDRTVRA